MAYNLRSASNMEAMQAEDTTPNATERCTSPDNAPLNPAASMDGILSFLMQQEEKHQREKVDEESRRRQEKIEERQWLQEHLINRIVGVEESVEGVKGRLETLEGEVSGLQEETDRLRQETSKFLQQETEKLRAEVYQHLERHATFQEAPIDLEFQPPTSYSALSPQAPSFQYQPSQQQANVTSARPNDARPIQRPTLYDGKLPIDGYLIQFETAADINQWGPDEKLKFLITSLTGPALSVLQTLPPERQHSYAELVAALRARFQDGRTGEWAKITLQDRTRKAKESLPELAADIETLVRRAYPQINEIAVESLACDYFTRALINLEVRQQVKLRGPTTLRQALEAATQIEAALLSTQKTPATRHPVRAISSGGPDQQIANNSQQVQAAVEYVLKEALEKVQEGKTEGNKDRRIICYNCSKPGHIARNCRRPKRSESRKPSEAGSEN